MTARHFVLAVLLVPAVGCAPAVDFDSLTARVDAGTPLEASPLPDSSIGNASQDDAGAPLEAATLLDSSVGDASPAEAGPGDAALSSDARAADERQAADTGPDQGIVDRGLDASTGGACQGVPGGWYCATDGLHGYDANPTDLVYCFGFKIVSADRCGNGCFITPPSHPDTCDQCAGKADGLYCAYGFAAAASQPFFRNNVVYSCVAGHIAAASSCADPAASCLERVTGQACCSAPDAGNRCAS